MRDDFLFKPWDIRLRNSENIGDFFLRFFFSRAEKTEAFMQMLRELSGLEVVSFDERYTSVVAHKFLSDSGLSTKKHKSLVDAVSAALILQDYLDAKKQKNNNS